MLSIKQFTAAESDPAKTVESKIQRVFRKLKTKIPDQGYKHLYGTVKMHKLPVNHLPSRPIVSNINTSTYNLARFFQNYYLHYFNHMIMLDVLMTSFKILKGRIYQLAIRWYLLM